jgi:hypothetical protein
VPAEPPVTTEKPPYRPFELPGIPQPDRISENRPPSVRPTFPGSRYNGDVTLESPNNIVGVSDTGTAGGSTERPAVIPESTSSHWLSTLREIKQRIEQFTEGGFERTSHLDQVRVLIRSAEGVSYASTLPRANHQIMFSFAAVVCASSCPAPPSLLPTLHLRSAF